MSLDHASCGVTELLTDLIKCNHCFIFSILVCLLVMLSVSWLQGTFCLFILSSKWQTANTSQQSPWHFPCHLWMEQTMSLGHLKIYTGSISQYAVKYSQIPTERKDVSFLVCPQSVITRGVGTDHQWWAVTCLCTGRCSSQGW